MYHTADWQITAQVTPSHAHTDCHTLLSLTCRSFDVGTWTWVSGSCNNFIQKDQINNIVIAIMIMIRLTLLASYVTEAEAYTTFFNPHVYCRMGFPNTLPFPALHLSRNAAIVSESLKISDQHMAKRYSAVFIHKQPLEGFQTLVLPPLASLSPLCIANFQVAASSRKMETKGK